MLLSRLHVRPHEQSALVVHETYPEPGHWPPDEELLDEELLDEELLLEEPGTLHDATRRKLLEEALGARRSGVHLATFWSPAALQLEEQSQVLVAVWWQQVGASAVGSHDSTSVRSLL